MKIELSATDILHHLMDHYQDQFGTKLGATVRGRLLENPVRCILIVDPIIEDEQKEETAEDVDL